MERAQGLTRPLAARPACLPACAVVAAWWLRPLPCPAPIRPGTPHPPHVQHHVCACRRATLKELRLGAPAAADAESAGGAAEQGPAASTAAAVVARGVTVFRVDSLEGDAIGQAVVWESWGPASGGSGAQL